MHQRAKKTIGILGGMGAAATALFFAKLIRALQNKGLKEDKDFPEILLYNLPLDGMGADGRHLSSSQHILPQLLKGAEKLKQGGAEFLVMPCNTIHVFLPALQENIDIPVINIIEQTAKVVAQSRIRKVGVLATKITKEHCLYEKSLKVFGIKTIWPTQEKQIEINRIIARVTAGEQKPQDTEKLQEIVVNFAAAGAEGAILGCTELPIIAPRQESITKNFKMFDTLEILAKAAADFALELKFNAPFAYAPS